MLLGGTSAPGAGADPTIPDYMKDPKDFTDLMDRQLATAMAHVKLTEWDAAAAKLKARRTVLEGYKKMVREKSASALAENEYGMVEECTKTLQLCGQLKSYVIPPDPEAARKVNSAL